MGAVSASEYVASLNEEQQRHVIAFIAFMNRAIKEVAYAQGDSSKERNRCLTERSNGEKLNLVEDFMKINDIETSRLLLRGFTKEDALWAYSIWNNPEMGQYLPDEAQEEIDDEYLKMLEGLGEDEECCYLIPVFKGSLERVGTCSFMISDDKKVYDIAYCVHKNFWCQGYATEIAQGMIDYARSQGAEKVTIYVNQENTASNRVAQKCGGKIVIERTYKKKGTDIIMKDYKYEIVL